MSIKNLLSSNLKSEQNLEVNSITTSGGLPMGPVFTDYVSNISPKLTNVGTYKNTSIFFSDEDQNTWWIESDSNDVNDPTDFPTILLSRQGATKLGGVQMQSDNTTSLFNASTTPRFSLLYSNADSTPNLNSTPTLGAATQELMTFEPGQVQVQTGTTLDMNTSQISSIEGLSYTGGTHVTYDLASTVGTGAGTTFYLTNLLVDSTYHDDPTTFVFGFSSINVNVEGVYHIDLIGSITFMAATNGIATFFVGPTGSTYPTFWASNNVSPLFPGVYPCSLTRYLTPADTFVIGMTNNSNGVAQFNNNATKIHITRIA